MVSLPALTLAQMQELERRMETDYYLERIQMMENGGRNLALLARRMLDDDIEDRPIVVLAGLGLKGGAGLAAARHLVNWGAWVQVLCAFPLDEYEGTIAQQLRALRAAGTSFAWAEDGWELPPCDLVIDAIGGEVSSGESGITFDHKKVEYLIALANSSVAPILSVEVPTGVEPSTGKLQARHVHTDATLALGLPKVGTLVEPGRGASGDLYLADIGVPQLLLEGMGFDLPPLFARDTLLRLTAEDGTAAVDDE